jgi:hypothetical protein
MRKQRCRVNHRLVVAATALTVMVWVALAPDTAAGQNFWPEDTPKLPMAKSWIAEKAELPPYAPPRTPDGQPDIQGFWRGASGDGTSVLEDHEYIDPTTPAQESFVSDPADGRVPYTPWALAKRNELLAGLGRGWPGESGEHLYAPPGAFCLYAVPGISFAPQEIVQKPDSVIMLNNEGYRVIPTDGRPAIDQHVKLWYGNSRGHWEGNTLVVEVTSLNGGGWFDSTGQFYSENTRAVERWTLVDADTIDYEVTIEDPTIYTRPWTMNFPKRRAGTEPPGPRGSTAVRRALSTLPPVADPYANEHWETACYEGNAGTVEGIRSLGFQWFSGVTPPN